MNATTAKTTALMTAVAIATVTGGNSALAATAAAALAIGVGPVCVIGWLARLGYVSDLLSKPVLTGYMAGIAVLMIVSQLGKITGLSVPSDSTLGEIAYTATHLGDIHLPTLIMSAAVPAAELYTEGHNAHEFVRTVSRLIEMRTHDYLAEAHRPD